MALDDRAAQRLQRVVQGDGGVSVAGGVDHQGAGGLARLLHPVDQLALVVGLAELDLESERLRAPLAAGADVLQRIGAIDMGLADAQEVEVGPAQHIDGFRHSARRDLAAL